MTVWSGEDLHLALVFTLIEGLGLRQVTTGILHELALSALAAETVGLTLKLLINPLPEHNRLSRAEPHRVAESPTHPLPN
jgi:hypothetical protein